MSNGSETVNFWRTRKDPFGQDIGEIEEMLEVMPELAASTLFEHLQDKYPGRYADGQRRTLERKVAKWKTLNGKGKEIFFDQVQIVGEYMQLDWMCCNSLKVIIGDEEFNHLLCHCVLPYSNWEWATVCFSENQLSLRLGLQNALFELGGVPKILQVDNCSSATHRLGKDLSKRDFTDSFLSTVDHFRMKARTISVGKANQNGSVEKHNDHFRRRLDQALLLRRSRCFGSKEEYEEFVSAQSRRANKNRHKKVAEEKEFLKKLPPTKLLGFDEECLRVGKGSTLRIRKRVYSVPSRLIGEQLKCCIYLDRIELYSGPVKVYQMPRIYKEKQGIRWQDLISSMLQKPGAFERYRYRDVFFPNSIFENVCLRLVNERGHWQGELEYLKILNHFRHLDDETLAGKLMVFLSSEERLSLDRLHQNYEHVHRAFVVKPFVAKLESYDCFLEEVSNG